MHSIVVRSVLVICSLLRKECKLEISPIISNSISLGSNLYLSFGKRLHPTADTFINRTTVANLKLYDLFTNVFKPLYAYRLYDKNVLV